MSRIEVLDKRTIDSIAAGEVVERPASVAKELVENSIDAGAQNITVEIKNGGKSLLRVTDNGCGIPGDQVRLAFLRHATSKLRNIDELAHISSLGFRGEALSSISAVSQVELITRTSDQIAGTRFVIEGGVEKAFDQVGAPYGTTFIMKNLFFNTPAREKFLKSALTEGNAVSSYMEQLALSHPDISFNFISDGRQKIFTSGSGDLKECIYRIYGREITKQLIEIDKSSGPVAIYGFIGRPEISRGNRNFENYFVNGRYVKNNIISSALEEAYRGHLMQHRYPFTLLNITTDPDKVDVNVHPAKMEVRFSDQREIFDSVRDIIETALIKNEEVPSIPASDIGSSKKMHIRKQNEEYKPFIEPLFLNEQKPGFNKDNNAAASSAEPSGAQNRDTAAGKGIPALLYKQEPASNADDPAVVNKQETVRTTQVRPPEAFEKTRSEKFKETEQKIEIEEIVREKQLSIFDEKDKEEISFRIIGQLFRTFILIEYNDLFYIIDQHAAHEKVMYEKIMRSLREKKISTQYLMPAKLVALTAKEDALLRQNIDRFTDLGFEVEHFEGREWRITGVPSNLYIEDTDELFKEILDGLEEQSGTNEMLLDKMASKACKAAVKAHNRLSDEEINALVMDLLKLDDPFHCPHGRPTLISMSHYELDKKFKRII